MRRKFVAGHGLNYLNIAPFRKLTEIEEVSIGHAIIARFIVKAIEENLGIAKTSTAASGSKELA